MISTVKLFLSLGKSTIKSNLNWGENYNKISGLNAELRSKESLPLVNQSVTREEFSSRFKHLSFTKYACGLAFIFSIIRAFGDQSMLGSFTAIGASIVFFLMLLQFSYRSWVSEFVWTHWDKRALLKRPRFGKFIENLVKRPQIIFSYNLD